MADQHPITPPPKLFKQWEDDILSERDNVDHVLDCAWRHGFHAGADQELEACCKWVDTPINYEDYRPGEESKQLRAARRPQPPSLKEQALAVIKNSEILDHLSIEDATILCRAVEQLND